MSKTLARVIGCGIVALLLVAVVGLVYKFTNGFNEDFKTFYVEYDGKQILTEDSKLTLESGEKYTFGVKYTFDNEKSEPKDYKVKIIPNVERDFDYTVNGEKYLFSKTGELTSAFRLKKEQTEFSIDIPAQFNLKAALHAINGGKTVVVPEDAETNNPYPYKLVVESYNSKVIYKIGLSITDPRVSDITVNPDKIVFGGGINNETTTPTEQPTDKRYSVEYLYGGDATNLSDLSIVGSTRANVGDRVNFSVKIGDSNYSISGMRVSVMNSYDDVLVNGSNGSYYLTMPQGNVYVWVYFKYTAPQNKSMYSIGYDSLGWASMDVVNLSCPGKAEAGETVTFTAIVKPEYASEYKISGINVEFSSGDLYIEDIQGNNGTYTFTMPDTATMEVEEYINLKFYIIPIDM